MRSNAEYARVLELVGEGLNDSQIARALGVPRCTVRDWRRGCTRESRLKSAAACRRCGHPSHDFGRLPAGSYAYVLGMYLGDGHICRTHTWRLRITLDLNWPGIILECAGAMRDLFPENAVGIYQPDPGSNYVVASLYSEQLVCLFPQHGTGPKHLRSIELREWQQEVVIAQPEPFLRGLIHSDGCRFLNRVHIKEKIYTYPRYNFTNASEDIRRLFTDSCDQLGIAWRQMNARNISIARREAVERLDEFVGPKY